MAGYLRKIRVDHDGLDIEWVGQPGPLTPEERHEERLGFAEITRIEIFKVDLMTIDEIRADIFFEKDDEEYCHTVSEDDECWPALISALKKLPGLDLEWYRKVVHPPFTENRRTIFEKPT